MTSNREIQEVIADWIENNYNTIIKSGFRKNHGIMKTELANNVIIWYFDDFLAIQNTVKGIVLDYSNNKFFNDLQSIIDEYAKQTQYFQV